MYEWMYDCFSSEPENDDSEDEDFQCPLQNVPKASKRGRKRAMRNRPARNSCRFLQTSFFDHDSSGEDRMSGGVNSHESASNKPKRKRRRNVYHFGATVTRSPKKNARTRKISSDSSSSARNDDEETDCEFKDSAKEVEKKASSPEKEEKLEEVEGETVKVEKEEQKILKKRGRKKKIKPEKPNSPSKKLISQTKKFKEKQKADNKEETDNTNETEKVKTNHAEHKKGKEKAKPVIYKQDSDAKINVDKPAKIERKANEDEKNVLEYNSNDDEKLTATASAPEITEEVMQSKTEEDNRDQKPKSDKPKVIKGKKMTKKIKNLSKTETENETKKIKAKKNETKQQSKLKTTEKTKVTATKSSESYTKKSSVDNPSGMISASANKSCSLIDLYTGKHKSFDSSEDVIKSPSAVEQRDCTLFADDLTEIEANLLSTAQQKVNETALADTESGSKAVGSSTSSMLAKHPPESLTKVLHVSLNQPQCSVEGPVKVAKKRGRPRSIHRMKSGETAVPNKKLKTTKQLLKTSLQSKFATRNKIASDTSKVNELTPK